MRSYRVHAFGEPSSMVIDELDDLAPGNDEVLVDVEAIGLNFPDVLVVRGQYQFLKPLPFTPGKDLAGVVRAVGSAVQGIRPGDRVLSHVESGAYAEQALALSGQTYVLPDDMSFSEAAAMGLVYQTAYFALVERARLASGETVLVGGAAGGIGLAAVQVAKGLGATVVAGVRGDEEAALARESGADYTIDLSGGNLRDGIRDQIRALPLEKGGVDIVIDPLGADFFAGAIRALAWCGRLVVIGFAAGEIPTIKVNYLLVKNIAVLGIQWSDYRDYTPERVHEAQQALFELWRQGKVRPHIARSVGFEALPEALSLVGQGKVRGKAVVTVRQASA
ncbi:NADPH:quinone oxidoreductase family protein [Castellaniella sp.]|uniref:NADPH:quinone oxidoreductase family protein n=1 Tax=Castellaniella sp. TaxID=1955812 RepID=UPI00355D638A